MAESEYNGKPGKWRTVKGRKVFFPDGEDEKAVINEAFGDDYKPSKKRINKGKFEKSDDGENWEELEDTQSYNDYYADEDEFDLNEDGDFEEGKFKIQVKYDGKQIEMEIPSNIEEDWQVDEAVKEKLEQIEGKPVENFEWDIAENEGQEEFNKAMDDAGYEINKEEYGIKKKEELNKGNPYDPEKLPDEGLSQEELEKRMVNDPNVTGSNKEPVNDMDPYERPAERIENSEEDEFVKMESNLKNKLGNYGNSIEVIDYNPDSGYTRFNINGNIPYDVLKKQLKNIGIKDTSIISDHGKWQVDLNLNQNPEFKMDDINKKQFNGQRENDPVAKIGDKGDKIKTYEVPDEVMKKYEKEFPGMGESEKALIKTLYMKGMLK